MIDILLSTDNHYVMPTGVLMESIGINSPGEVCYHILVNESFSEESRKALIAEAGKFGSQCFFYVIGEEVTKDLPFGQENMPKHVSLATYYRLFIAKVLPESLHRVLYLDGDMIVRKSLLPLWNEDLTGYALGAVHDMDEPGNSQRMQFCGLHDYFNAGMLLVNLDYWREHDCTEQFLNFIRQHGDKILFHDQDVLNGVLFDKVKCLPLTYNFQNGFILAPQHKRYDVARYQSEIDACKTDPAIIHYTVYNKPWNVACFHPYRDLWREYQKQTVWKNFRYEEPKPTKWIHYIRNFLFRYTSYVPKYDRTEYESLRKDITKTASFKEAMEDKRCGRIYQAENAEDMFKQILG